MQLVRTYLKRTHLFDRTATSGRYHAVFSIILITNMASVEKTECTLALSLPHTGPTAELKIYKLYMFLREREGRRHVAAPVEVIGSIHLLLSISSQISSAISLTVWVAVLRATLSARDGL